jgi:hypothetical protein
LKVTDFKSGATFQLSAREGDISPFRSIQTIGSRAGIAEHIETPMISHGTPKGEPGGVSTIRKTPPYCRAEGSAVQPTLPKSIETKKMTTNHVIPIFKKELPDRINLSSFQRYLRFSNGILDFPFSPDSMTPRLNSLFQILSYLNKIL